MITVAVIGPDGAGKSTITGRLEHASLPAPVKRIYMGVNLEASSVMLPTTRLALAVKSARGRRPDMVGPGSAPPAAAGGGPARRAARGAARTVRLLLWLAEEWFRQGVATYHRWRGAIVVFDRHFVADYFHAGNSSGQPRPATTRVHDWLLRHAYPKPDLVICLDAPGQVLFDRKGEADPAWLEARRHQYLALREFLPDVVVVDADRPLDAVTSDVVTAIEQFVEKRRR